MRDAVADEKICWQRYHTIAARYNHILGETSILNLFSYILNREFYDILMLFSDLKRYFV